MMPASRDLRRTDASARAAAAVGRTILVLDAYERHGPELLGFLVRITRERAAAEDLLQDTFLRLVAEARAGRAPTDVRAWLFRVAANRAISAARRRATVAKWAPFLARPSAAESSEDAVVARDAMSRLEAALARLPADGRTAVLLAAQGLGTASVARAIGRTELATRSLLCRSRLRIRDQLEREDDDR